MKSYTLQTTIALLIMLLGCTLADTEAETQERRTLRVPLAPPPEGVDNSLSSWGLFNLNFAQHSAVRGNGTKPEYGSHTIKSATERAAKIAGSKGKGKKSSKAPSAIKAVKSKGKGKGKGKACPKSRKKDKSPKSKGKAKGKGKGSKKSSAPSSSFSPSAGPSASQMPSASQSPSDTPSDSLQPSGSWCLEEHPTVSPGPSTSTAPSSEPSLSQQPSISAAPSMSSNPSNSPSVSAAPSGSSHPSNSPSASSAPSSNPGNAAASNTFVGPADAVDTVRARSTCTVQLVVYTDNENEIDQFDGNGNADATAGSPIKIDWPQNLDSARDYTVGIEFQVTNSPNKETIAQGLTDTISKPMVLELVGCAGMAQAEGMEIFTNAENAGQRRLQANSKDDTLAVMDNWVCGR